MNSIKNHMAYFQLNMFRPVYCPIIVQLIKEWMKTRLIGKRLEVLKLLIPKRQDTFALLFITKCFRSQENTNLKSY